MLCPPRALVIITHIITKTAAWNDFAEAKNLNFVPMMKMLASFIMYCLLKGNETINVAKVHHYHDCEIKAAPQKQNIWIAPWWLPAA